MEKRVSLTVYTDGTASSGVAAVAGEYVEGFTPGLENVILVPRGMTFRLRLETASTDRAVVLDIQESMDNGSTWTTVRRYVLGPGAYRLDDELLVRGELPHKLVRFYYTSGANVNLSVSVTLEVE